MSEEEITKIEWLEPIEITKTKKVVEIKDYKGEILEFVLITNSNSYAISIDVDYRKVISKSFSEFEMISKHSDHFSAYQYGDLYVFRVKKVKFREAFLISIRPSDEVLSINRAVTFYKRKEK